jgi:single-stranded DNA-binding protein
VEERDKGNQVFRLFVPCMAYSKAEHLAERLDAGDLVTVQGRLCWRSPQRP